MGLGAQHHEDWMTVVMLMPPPPKPKEITKLVDTSSQASTQDDAEMGEASLEGVPATISPIATVGWSRSITPPAEAAELWENVNKASEELLATKSSIDACRQRITWELGIEHCLNKSETAEAIKEAKALCSCTIREAEATCSIAIMDAKRQGTSQAKSL